MLSALVSNTPLLGFIVAIPVLYVLMVALGRTLKRHQQVQLGLAYRLFCIAFALWLPGHLYDNWGADPRIPLAAALKQIDAATAVLATFFLIALMRRYFWQAWFEHKYRVRAPKFLSDLAGLILFLGAAVYALSMEQGQPITGLAVGSTLLAAIIGLALQDLLGNIIAGIALEIGKPFRSGDWLVIEHRQMEVVEVNWRSTRLRTTDDIYFDIPNRTVAGSTITNLSLHGKKHALRVQVGFDYQTPPNFVKDRMAHAVAQARGVLPSPPPKVFLTNFAESALTYEIKFWIEDEAQRNDIMDAVHTNIWYEARRSQIRIPYPIRTVQVERQAAKRDQPGLETARGCLRKQPFLQMLNDEQTDKLLHGARVLHFGRGEHVIEQGAFGQSMFLMLGGEADVFVRSDGHETRVGEVMGGEYCGEMSLLTGEPRSATVVARTDCAMWEVDKAVLGEILQENSELVQRLSEILAARRLENEGVLASEAGRLQMEIKTKEYADGFLVRLRSFFEL